MTNHSEFGKRVRDLREEKKRVEPSYSLRKFAERVGISATYLSKVETGDFDPPGADKIIRIAELLGIDADELLALANKIDPELGEIIQREPKAMADLLRAAREKGLSSADLGKITKKIQNRKH